MQPLSLKAIRDLTRRGIKEDQDRNYVEAVRLYEESEIYFNHTIEHELKSDLLKNLLRLQWKNYQVRIKTLRLHLERRKIKEDKRRIKKLRELQYEHCD